MELAMDWIERWFGFSPDDGDGTVEWLIVMAVVLISVAVASSVVARRRETAFRLPKFIGLKRSGHPDI
jgi:hypothetical protein